MCTNKTNERTNKRTIVKFVVYLLVAAFPLFAHGLDKYKPSITDCSEYFNVKELYSNQNSGYIYYNPNVGLDTETYYCSDNNSSIAINNCRKRGDSDCNQTYYNSTDCVEVRWEAYTDLTVYAGQIYPQSNLNWINGKANYITSQSTMCCGKNATYCGTCQHINSIDHDVYWDLYAYNSGIVTKFNNISRNYVKHYYLTIEEKIPDFITSNTYCSAANDDGTCKTWTECLNGGKVYYEQIKYQLQRCTNEYDCEDITLQSDLTRRPIYNVSQSATSIYARKIPDLSCINKTVVEVKTQDDCYKEYLTNDTFNDENSNQKYNANETFTDDTGTYILSGNSTGYCFYNKEKNYCSKNACYFSNY